jgi:hypothetical protein
MTRGPDVSGKVMRRTVPELSESASASIAGEHEWAMDASALRRISGPLVSGRTAGVARRQGAIEARRTIVEALREETTMNGVVRSCSTRQPALPSGADAKMAIPRPKMVKPDDLGHLRLR